MAHTLDEFVGTYTIRHGQGTLDLVRAGYLLSIGTGAYGDPAPDGIKVGVSIVDPSTRQRVVPKDGNGIEAYAYLVDGTLNGCTYFLEGEKQNQLVSFQIGLMVMDLPSGGQYKAPTLMISVGDPENAGVWGADDETGDDPPDAGGA